MIVASRTLPLFCCAALLCAQRAAAQVEPSSAAEHWAFVTPAAPAVPAVADARWSTNAIDRFVRARLVAAELTPRPRADRRTLIRRVTFDLTGLPPTRAEISAFLADDAPGAWERLVDRLLKSPHYGEQMAHYWLDLVRFADTNGVHHDHYRELSPYRDWVIRSFDQNLPYDRFATAQIAGDLLPDATTDDLVASGFHRLHLIIDRGTALPEESLARNVIDRVTAFGTAFLGLTVHCAVCHDHKYDPITQRDFYGLYAFFNNLDAAPETGARGTSDFYRGLQPPYIDLASPEQQSALAAREREVATAEARLAGLAADAAERSAAEAEVKRCRRARDELLRQVPAAMVMKERAEPRPAHVFLRGAYDHLGAPVERATPAFLPPLPGRSGDGPPTRLDLAHWLVSPTNPLTARVEVNRIWHQLFGVGLVETAEDLGTQGERPSHPELLDHLAITFVESGWDVKALVRRIVTTETYRQDSRAAPAEFERDPDNRLLARGSRFRMDAEMIRDQILASSGLLNPEHYGRSVKPPQPDGIWRAVTLPDSLPRTFTPDRGDAIYRRSVYTFWKRGMPPPQLTILNAPTREFCTARRERTNTPLQALLLLNEREYLGAARHLAAATLRQEPSDAERLDVLYETITSQLPDARERAILTATLDDLRTAYAHDPALAAALADDDDAVDAAPAELAAWTMVASAIYNLDITRTRQ